MEDPFDIQATQALQSRYPGNVVCKYIYLLRKVLAILDRRVGDMMSSQVTEALEDVDICY